MLVAINSKNMNKILLAFCFIFLLLYSKNVDSQVLDSLEQRFSTEKDPEAKIDLAITISREINRNGNTNGRDFYYAELAVDLAESLDDDLQLAKSLDNLGLLHRFNQRYAQAIPLHMRAWGLIKDSDSDVQLKMRFANNIGVAARYDQDHALAVKYYLEALKLAEAENDLRNIAISSNGLGNSLGFIHGRSGEAVNYFMKALQTERERGNQRGEAMNLLSIGSYYTRIGEYNQANEILQELLQLNLDLDDKHGQAITYEFIGHNYFDEGEKPEEAEAYFQKAMDLFQELNNQIKVGDILLHLGAISEIENNTGKALQQYEKANAMARQMNNKSLLASSAARISAVLERRGNFKDALAFNKMAEAFKDSIDLIEQESVIEGLKMRYDFEQKENEIKLLRANQEIKDAELIAQRERFKRAWIVYAFVSLIFLSFALVIILGLRNLNLKKNIRLREEEQMRERMEQEYQRNLWQAEILASRMQMNPHFLFNCLNSVKYFIQKKEDREAINYLTTLSRLMREILQTGKQQSISLYDELEMIKKYVLLEANRFDQHLDFGIHLNGFEESNLKSILIPPLILQPYVENAIWHGLVPSQRTDKKLSIGLGRENSHLVISVEDNGVGRSQNRKLPDPSHKEMGAQITADRISLFNKMTDSEMKVKTIDLKNENQQPAGTRVNIYLRENRN